MQHQDARDQEIQTLRERLSRLGQASLRINESLDFDKVLQEMVDSARALTASHYGVITLHDENGVAGEFLASGMTADEKAEVLQFVRIIESQSDLVRDLIGELLDVARIKTGTLSVAPEPTEVSALVDEARNTFLTGGAETSFSWAGGAETSFSTWNQTCPG